ncbi:MAG: hsp70 family protein [Proteobacteria bacterium]|nr:hsp70 family protein [Pseudomonadota bacterium]
MELRERRFLIGIDLGTTNSALSWVDLEKDSGKNRIHVLPVPQLVGGGEVGQSNVLPSFLYLPGKYDVNRAELALPWDLEPATVAGILAREQGSRVPGRLVASAKSWLCHSQVDRTAPILPWAADQGVDKLSPVAATAAYLAHLRAAWNHFQGEDEDLFLENQNVIITVPASFDQVARDFTVEAARVAGIPEITLLEEPLAAFYSWLVFHENDWDRHVSPGELILAVDVGGGTSDFTLITLRDVDGHPRFERIAVGDHLILGGDNIDLALARQTEARMKKGQTFSLNANRWQALCHQCRMAKETILSGQADSYTVTLMGEGGRLIAGTLSAVLDREEIETAILEGFFPLVEASDPGPAAQKAGITEFGLPYAQDAVINRHICRFLERHAADVKEFLGREVPYPDLILFNGGALKPGIIQNRIREGIRHWFHADAQPRVLENPDLDLAVSRGAAYYGLVKAGKGVRVGSGSARGYYLALGGPEAGGKPEKAICLMERGVEEGSRIPLEDREFTVLANQPVSFTVYSSSFRSGDRSGDIIDIDDTLTLLPPIRTVIQFGKKAGQTAIPVNLEAHYTELGTLALWCRSRNTDHQWRLSFQLRDADLALDVADDQVFEEETVHKARELIRGVYKAGDSAVVAPERLANALADVLETPRGKWPLGLIRRLGEDLLEVTDGRRLSADHEARWLNLTGFCLRPGFGEAIDEHRIKTLWPLFQKGPAFGKNPQVRMEWWVLWRRVAGGLSAGHQRQVLQELSSMLRPKKSVTTKIPAHESVEMWMLLANLERLSVKDKTVFGRHLLKELNPKKSPAQLLWSLSRLGARGLLYGPLDRVIPAQEAQEWVSRVMKSDWKNAKPAAQAVAHMARRTGDRKRDLEDVFLNRVADWLSTWDFATEWKRMVSEVIPMDRRDEDAMFGEALPSGIILHG